MVFRIRISKLYRIEKEMLMEMLVGKDQKLKLFEESKKSVIKVCWKNKKKGLFFYFGCGFYRMKGEVFDGGRIMFRGLVVVKLFKRYFVIFVRFFCFCVGGRICGLGFYGWVCFFGIVQGLFQDSYIGSREIGFLQ